MAMVYIFMAQGFEAIEFTTPLDMLIRAGIPVRTVSVTGELLVKSSQNIPIMADALFEDVDFADADMLILPGGQPGATNLANHKGVELLLRQFMDADKPVAAICAAPMVLGGHGLIDGRKVTTYPGCEPGLGKALCTGALVEQDANLITGKGPAAAVEFANAIIRLLRSEELQKEVCSKMMF
ncbi:MAG: DJ-1/PfpI family protein [Bacteroidaceae bacterium]|nr:DJ-1/PfpI family protein [Bacteroidaceae bacterium]MBO5933247.1 DJ-1/PfpI family protein [Bacteroidaceae bacterium]MBO5952040.1 DJ-1/PfpI family protein [Bacteroidaceae bacterium]